MNGITK